MRNRETIEFLPETKQLALIVKSHFYFKAVVCRLIVLLFTCSCLGVGLPCQTWGLELPEKPVPRIELGLHSDKIYQIGLDRSGRWLVTASEDKTARVWDMRQLRAGGDDVRPVRILRPPIGPGNDGKLYSVAISPDGELVATAGWTQSNGMGHSSSSDYAVYLFSRRTGRLLRKAEGLQNTITHLAFSPNGRLLAATLYSTNGVQLFAVTPAKLTKGKVNMKVNYGLEPDEIDAGYILSCQSHPVSDEIEVDFD